MTAELRKLSPRSQRIARHQIQNLLFNLQMNQDELPGNSAMFMPHSVPYNQAAAFYQSFPYSPIASSTPMPLKTPLFLTNSLHGRLTHQTHESPKSLLPCSLSLLSPIIGLSLHCPSQAKAQDLNFLAYVCYFEFEFVYAI